MNILYLIVNFFAYLLFNLIRHRFTYHINRMTLIISTTVFISVNTFIMGTFHFFWMSLLIVFVAAASYELLGAMIVFLLLIVCLVVTGIAPEDQFLSLSFGYFIISLGMGLTFYYIRRESVRFHHWQGQFYGQSKNLHVLREVSLALQSTLKLEKLLHIFLTAITAGSGLGFNRAMLFLKDDTEKFVGRIAIGPLSVEQGHTIWENAVLNKFALKDFIQLQEKAKVDDQELNNLLHSFQFSMQDECFLLKKLEREKEPFIVHENENNDRLFVVLRETFSIGQFAVIPLLLRGRITGILIIDNIVNKKPIEYDDLNNIMPLATQAAMAIENASLYEKTEMMAIKDGLTGLYNKRFLDRMLPHFYDKSRTNSDLLSALVLDIDNFKNYNDTHGHLKGNEVLIAISEILQEEVGDDGIVCRFGGEEFVIIIHNGQSAVRIGQSIRERVFKQSFYGEMLQPNGSLTVSIGVATYPDDGGEITDIIKNADEALYCAKNQGKNQLVTFSERGKNIDNF